MPGVEHHDHPASVGHKLWHSGQRDSELVTSSHCPPHSGPLCLLWAVHRQSLLGPPHKRTGSSHGHSEGRLVDMTLLFCRNTSYTEHNWVVTVNICPQTGCVEVQVQMSLHKTSHTSFTTGLKTLLTFRPDALVFFRRIFALKKTRASGRNVGKVSTLLWSWY